MRLFSVPGPLFSLFCINTSFGSHDNRTKSVLLQSSHLRYEMRRTDHRIWSGLHRGISVQLGFKAKLLTLQTFSLWVPGFIYLILEIFLLMTTCFKCFIWVKISNTLKVQSLSQSFSIHILEEWTMRLIMITVDKCHHIRFEDIEVIVRNNKRTPTELCQGQQYIRINDMAFRWTRWQNRCPLFTVISLWINWSLSYKNWGVINFVAPRLNVTKVCWTQVAFKCCCFCKVKFTIVCVCLWVCVFVAGEGEVPLYSEKDMVTMKSLPAGCQTLIISIQTSLLSSSWE